MEYFKTGIMSVIGGQPGKGHPTEAEVVESLVDRVRTSTLLTDRRDACRALKSLAKKFRLQVGTQGMDVLTNVLEYDRNDAEIVSFALDALCFVISGYMDDKEDDKDHNEAQEQELGSQFAEIYIKNKENVTLILNLLEEFDFRVRWPAIKLLTGLLIHRTREVQDCILENPLGVTRLVDLLSESREVIRNDVLLLLTYLTKKNANIQKIVAFQNTFDRLLMIIAEEGYIDGGVVVEDCLQVLQNLLKNNSSNQNLFKEGNYISKLSPFFSFATNEDLSSDVLWTHQRVSCILFMLDVLRTLISPDNPSNITSSCQKVMNQCGLLERLCTIVLTAGITPTVLAHTTVTVADIIRGHHTNQEYFNSICANTAPPTSAISILLIAMSNEKQSFSLRLAVLYCFQCFLYKNELGQAQIIQTLLPSSTEVSRTSPGSLLCAGLFDLNPFSHWCAAIALSHALVDNSVQKEQLLRVQLCALPSDPPVTLLTQCSLILQHQGGQVQTRLGFLILVGTWLAHSVSSVSQFLSLTTNVPFLTSLIAFSEGDEGERLVQGLCAFILGLCIEFNDGSQAGFTKTDLCHLIEKRIGLETYIEKLSLVSTHESYSRTLQNPHLKYEHPSQVLLDHEFVKLFKSLEGTIINAIKPSSRMNGSPDDHLTAEQHSLLQQYKDVIREQDQKLNELQHHLQNANDLYGKAKIDNDQRVDTEQQLRDQLALLKAKNACAENSGDHISENETLRQEIQKLHQANQELTVRLEEQTNYEFINTPVDNSEVVVLKERIKSLESQIVSIQLSSQDLRDQNQLLEIQKQNSQVELENTKKALQTTRLEHANMKKEQEDLLVLLTDNDALTARYKKRLIELGEKIEEDDFDGDDDVDFIDDYTEEDS